MTFTQQELEHDYLEMPDPQTVSYQTRSGASTLASGEDVEYCERRNPSWKDLQAHKTFVNETTLIWFVWRVPFENTFGAGKIPKKGERITHDSQMWIVQTVKEELLRNRYRLFCTQGIT
jgi:hypothetical protein